MNPITDILIKVLKGINDLINRLDRQSVDAIRKSYIFLIFLIAVTLGIVAWNTGKKKATIDSPPIAEVTNDVFQTDIKRERPSSIEGIFESEVRLISPDKGEREKLALPAREKIEPDVEMGIVDISPGKERSGERTVRQDTLLYEESRSREREEPDVRPLPSREITDEESPIEENRSGIRNRDEGTDRKQQTDKSKENRSRVIRSREPDTSPIDSDTIIIRE